SRVIHGAMMTLSISGRASSGKPLIDVVACQVLSQALTKRPASSGFGAIALINAPNDHGPAGPLARTSLTTVSSVIMSSFAIATSVGVWNVQSSARAACAADITSNRVKRARVRMASVQHRMSGDIPDHVIAGDFVIA